MKASKSKRAGLTLVEVMISFSLLSLILVAFTHTVRTAREQHRVALEEAQLERLGERTMNRVLDALRYADWSSLAPLPSPPFSSPWMEFQVVESDIDGVPVYSDPCRLEFDAASGVLSWVQSAGLPSEHSVSWTQRVSQLQVGETLDGTDENGNGLIDEGGLCFSFEDSTLVVRMTLSTTTPGGDVLIRSFEARMDPRNDVL